MHIQHDRPLFVYYIWKCDPDLPYPPKTNQTPQEFPPSSPLLRRAQLVHPSRRQKKIFHNIFNSHRLPPNCVLSFHFDVRHKSSTQPSTPPSSPTMRQTFSLCCLQTIPTRSSPPIKFFTTKILRANCVTFRRCWCTLIFGEEMNFEDVGLRQI